MKTFAIVVLIGVSAIVFMATPVAFFVIYLFNGYGQDPNNPDVWLTLIPAVAIVLIWSLVIWRLRRGERGGP